MKTFICLIIMSLSVHAGLSINQISSDSDTIQNPLVINNKLVYQDEFHTLWFNDGRLNGSYKPMLNGQKITSNYLSKVGDDVVFINISDGNSVWKTDGENLTKLSDIPLTILYDRISNILTGSLKNSGNFSIITETGALVYDIQPLTLSINEIASTLPSVCMFDADNLLFRATDPSDASFNWYLYQSGKSTKIQFQNEDVTGSSLEFELQFSDSCFFKYYDYMTEKTLHYRIDNKGVVSEIVNPENGYFNNLFIFQNQVYLFLEGIYGNVYGTEAKELFSLDENSVVPTHVLNLDSGGFFANKYWVSENNLYISLESFCTKSDLKCTPVPPDPYKLLVYDASLNLINTIKNYKLQDFDLYTTIDKDFLIFKDGVTELVELNSGDVLSSIKDNRVEIKEVIGGSENNYYVYGKNQISNNLGIYKVTKQVVISNQLSGLWVSDQLQSQGLSIHTGTRTDSSQYIFVSFYIYRNGQPFWLAGSDELKTGQVSQVINLAEFKGQSFLNNDSNQDFEQSSFGTMRILPQACNTIQVQISPDNGEIINLDMSRIINTEFSNVCTDE